MYYENELNLLKKVLLKCRLQCKVIDPEAIISEPADELLRGVFNIDTSSTTLYDLFPDMRPRTIYRVSDTFAGRYIFFMLPFEEKETVFVIGPYLYEDISDEKIMEIAEIIGASPKSLKQLEFFYSSLPVITDESYIMAIISTFCEFLWNGAENFTFQEINRNYSSVLGDDSFSLENPDFSESKNIEKMEARYNFENELIVAVSQGNARKAEQMIAYIPTFAFESRIPDRLRNIKNYCIIMNTLFRKAAENGGVHPVYLDSLSSTFAKRIENLHSTEAARKFMLEILRSYCRLVKQHSLKNYSPIVKKAIILIESDLTADLSLRALSQKSNVSAGYFSVLFKKETGMTLTEFVNIKRIENAKRLLKTTNLQIQTVAQYCGILDLHYFCRIFKKAVGKTPLEYRNSPSYN